MKMKIDVAPETKITDIIIPPDIEEYKFITTHWLPLPQKSSSNYP